MKHLFKFLIIALLPFALIAKNEDYAQVAEQIKVELAKVVAGYKAGNAEQAVADTQNAYFGYFEDIEAAIRINLGQKKAYSMEKQFGEIRKAIKAGEPVEAVQERVDRLNKEIAEVLPEILTGHRLVGEYSEPKATADASELDTSKFAPEWKLVFDKISQNLEEAKAGYEAGNTQAAKNALNTAKFDNYRNTKLEIAIRQHIQDGKELDAKIQRKMNEALSGTANAITKEDFKNKLNETAKLVYDAIAKLPAETAKLAVVDMSEAVSDEAAADYSPVVKNINDKIAAALALYKSGNAQKAMGDVQDIYFDEFEASGMENKVGAIDVNLKTTIEGSFSTIVSLMKSGADETQLKEAAANLSSQLSQALEKTSGTSSPWALFIYSLTIILREGFEALIIVAAVVAYLVKTGNASKMGKVVYSSVSVAIALSFVMAWVMNLIFENAGQKREVMEGAVMLVAVGLLFYVGFWLLSNAGAKKWSSYIQGHVSEALSANSAAALWWTVFLAVFREGAETVLFYQALIFDAQNGAGYGMIAGGFVVGVVVLLIVYFVFKIFAIKIPIKPFFIFTSAIIFYMSIVFVGKGVMELVEGKIFVPTTIEGLKFPEWASSWLGLQPYYETLVPQSLMILALVIGVIIMRSKQKNQS